MSDPKVSKVFFKIKSTDSEKLDLAFEKFLGTLLMFVNDIEPDLKEIFENTLIQVGHMSSNCVVMIPLNTHDVHQNLGEQIEKTLKVLDDTGFRMTGTVGLGITFKDLLAVVNRDTMKGVKDPKKLKEMNEKSNLFKLITHGFAFRLKADITRKYLKEVRARVFKIFGNFINTLFPDKMANFFLKAFKGLQVRVKLSHEETYGLFQNSIGEFDLPDAVDLIDEIGMAAHEYKWVRAYDNMPFVKEFVDALHELGQCDLEVGYTSPQRTFSANLHTQGIKELFDNVLKGFSD